MTLWEHLEELRSRIVRMALAFLVGSIGCWIYKERLLAWLIRPFQEAMAKGHHPGKATLHFGTPTALFIGYVHLAALAGLIFALPIILYQIWAFIAPGLYSREKKYAIPFVFSSVLLFAAGGAVAILTFPKALDFLIGVSGKNIATFFTPSKYIGLYVLVVAAFGLAFEFPIVLVFLELAGVVPSRKLRNWRRPAVVVIFVIAAVITPSQDPYSLFAMAIPMCIFYEASILIGRILKK